ncbi:unnamed protein product [Moneuplotes crassus]|uniref:Uncharacterized protein n=1 Tax=Euplotes crassus TaxID=5936 RepID=A0AAD1UEZ5_EUPCR|nr:unnamed protein product [Moneuplotes crassus]
MINYDLESSQLIDDIWKQKAIADQQFKFKRTNLAAKEEAGFKDSRLTSYGNLKSIEKSVLTSKKPSTGYETYTHCSARKRSKTNKNFNLTYMAQKFRKSLNSSHRVIVNQREINKKEQKLHLRDPKSQDRKKKLKKFVKNYFNALLGPQKWGSQRQSFHQISLRKRITEAYNLNKRAKGHSKKTIRLKKLVNPKLLDGVNEKGFKNLKVGRRSTQPSKRHNSRIFMKIDKEMDNELYHITIKKNMKKKNLTISARNDKSQSKKSDYKIKIPKHKANEVLETQFGGSLLNLTDSLCIKNRKLLLMHPSLNTENTENLMTLTNHNPALNEQSENTLESINENALGNALFSEAQNLPRISASKTAENFRTK